MKITSTARRTIGVPCNPAIILSPGESKPITDEQLAEIRRHRMNRQWIENGVLVIAGEVQPKIKTKPKPEERTVGPDLPEGITGKGVEFDQSGGWYDVYVNGMKATTSRVRKAEAEKIAAEYE